MNNNPSFLDSVTTWFSQTFTLKNTKKSNTKLKKQNTNRTKNKRSSRTIKNKRTKKNNRNNRRPGINVRRLPGHVQISKNNSPPTDKEVENLFLEARAKGKFKKYNIEDEAKEALKKKDIKQMKTLLRKIVPKQ